MNYQPFMHAPTHQSTNFIHQNAPTHHSTNFVTHNPPTHISRNIMTTIPLTTTYTNTLINPAYSYAQKPRISELVNEQFASNRRLYGNTYLDFKTINLSGPITYLYVPNPFEIQLCRRVPSTNVSPDSHFESINFLRLNSTRLINTFEGKDDIIKWIKQLNHVRDLNNLSERSMLYLTKQHLATNIQNQILLHSNTILLDTFTELKLYLIIFFKKFESINKSINTLINNLRNWYKSCNNLDLISLFNCFKTKLLQYETEFALLRQSNNSHTNITPLNEYQILKIFEYGIKMCVSTSDESYKRLCKHSISTFFELEVAIRKVFSNQGVIFNPQQPSFTHDKKSKSFANSSSKLKPFVYNTSKRNYNKNKKKSSLIKLKIITKP